MEVEKIYFDMDGVLADFGRGVEEICGLTPPSQNAKHHKPGEDDEMWARVNYHAPKGTWLPASTTTAQATN